MDTQQSISMNTIKTLKAKAWIFFVIIATVIFLNSCKKEAGSEELNIDNQQKLRDWYTANVTQNKQNPFSTLSPDWDQIQVIEVGGKLVYEIGMYNPEKVFIGAENMDKKKAAEAFARNDTRFLMFENSKTGVLENGCYMSVVNTGLQNNLKSIHYKQPVNLTGNIYYFNPDGKMANGWTYRDGSPLQRISVSSAIEYKTMTGIRSEKVLAHTKNGGKLSYTQPAYCVPEYTLIYGTSCAGVDGYMNCTQYVIGREYTNNCEYGGGSGGGEYTPPNPTGGGGTGTGTSWLSTLTLLANPPGAKIKDIKAYLKCFDATKPATVAIYVDQPKDNTSDTWSGSPTDPNVGHTFVSISQGGITRTFGFYPNEGVNPFTSPQVNSTLVDDSEHKFSVGISIPVNATSLQAVLNVSNNFSNTYNLNSYNCTDFGLTVATAAGLSWNSSAGSWPGGGGHNPGNLGQDVRTKSFPANVAKNTSNGTAPKNTGTCN